MPETKTQLPSCEQQIQQSQLLALNALFAAARTGEKGRVLASAAKESWLTGAQCAELNALAHHPSTLWSPRLALMQWDMRQRAHALAATVSRWIRTAGSGQRVS